ncbi:hypothetical protein B5808_19245 (plasmid) [Cnuibacter physcomitrellae]|uniref:Glycosyltransferase family 28 N-terminal domain-containing protein n=1 Tax=Cnuibacter physcomitrellae TaxID=1619308 RepID=A0A1X9LR78_9MICO|nr:hypothetical protein B5808_19245 [Cnuibacter physcomitrellae]
MLLVTAGTRGDVEPFLALARAAAASGLDVRVAVPVNSGASVEGLNVVSLAADFSSMVRQQGASVLAAARSFRAIVRPAMRNVIVGAARTALAYRPDVIVAHPKVLSAPLIAAALDIPHVLVELAPTVTPTRAFPAAGTVTADLGSLNRSTYRAASLASALFVDALDEAAGLLGVTRSATPSPTSTLMPISPALLPRPDDWPSEVHMTGPWLHDEAAAAVDPDVAAFLAGGPFIYAGFGSMASGDPAARGRSLVLAARDRGLRLLVATGLGGIEVPARLRGDDVLTVGSVSHAQVLPHAVSAVHHGGIGTIQAAMRASTPSVVVPFMADQPFWGALLHRQGLAPAAIRPGQLTSTRVGRALDAATLHRPAVEGLSRQLGAEDGTAAALATIISYG